MNATLSASDALPRPVVLLADSDDETRALYAAGLRASGWQVEEAADGRDALVRALASRPQLVVTRLHLPFVDGCGLCQVLRADAQTAGVPIVAIADGGGAAARVRAARAGANLVLTLPVLPDELIDAAQTLLRASVQPHHEPERGGDGEPTLSRPGRCRRLPRYRTTSPPSMPPSLRCPSCYAQLQYHYSNVGGVNEQNREQWDVFSCSSPTNCGTFQYRHRTRKLRRVP